MRLAIAATALVLLSGSVLAQAKPDMVANADAVKWKPAASLPKGAQIAVISGDPSKSAPYVVRLKLPANYTVPAHRHPTVENVTVLSGGLRLRLGDTPETRTALRLGAGGFASLPAGTVVNVSTGKETVLQVHGIGPLGTEYVNPADDPAKSR